MYEGGMFTINNNLSLQTMDGGVYDLYSEGMSTHLLRVNSGSFTLNLRAENALDNVSIISFDSGTETNS